VVPGARVVVPVQRRRVVGVVAEVDAAPPAPTVAVKPILAAPDAEPAITPPLFALGVWINRYYGTPLGLALRALLPGALWSVQRPAGPAEQVERVLALTATLPSLLERERAFKRAPSGAWRTRRWRRSAARRRSGIWSRSSGCLAPRWTGS